MTESLENLLVVYCFANIIFEYLVVHGSHTDSDGNTFGFGAVDNSRKIIVIFY